MNAEIASVLAKLDEAKEELEQYIEKMGLEEDTELFASLAAARELVEELE